MSLLRLNNFTPGTTIISADVNAEFNQLVETLNGVKDVDVLHKFTHATTPVLTINQLSTVVTARLIKGQQNSVDTFFIKANGFIVGYPKCIRNVRPAVGNVGGGLDTLESFNLPVGNLLSNGDFVDVVYTISLNTNDNNKRIQLTIGGTVVLNTTAIDLDALGSILRVRASRVSDVSLDVSISTGAGNLIVSSAPALVSSVGRFSEDEFVNFAVADLDTNTLNFLLEAEGVADNDLVLFMVQHHVTQMS